MNKKKNLINFFFLLLQNILFFLILEGRETFSKLYIFSGLDCFYYIEEGTYPEPVWLFELGLLLLLLEFEFTLPKL
jgi:hypothetical protein